MRKNKFIKLIEHILVALPLLMVLVTCCYTIWNSNANQSYYGDTINQSNTELLNINTIQENDNVSLQYVSIFSEREGYNSYGLYVTDVKVLDSDLDFSNVNRVRFYHNANNYTWTAILLNNGSSTILLELYNQNISRISFTYISSFTDSTANNWLDSSNIFLKTTYVNYSYLSSVFEYSLSEFNNMGFGKIDFVSFFVDMFHNGQSNVYIDFANSYLNYMLFIECTFVLPLVLYWFIHIGENILYKFEKGEW